VPTAQLSAIVTEDVISHDRWFVARIATHILAFEGDSHVEWFEGNCEDYEADRRSALVPMPIRLIESSIEGSMPGGLSQGLSLRRPADDYATNTRLLRHLWIAGVS
jgi:hypothetical protein